jgi:hypothetical protein
MVLMVNCNLKNTSSNGKQKRGEGVSLPDPLLHLNSFPAVPLRRTEVVAEDNK